MSVYSTVDRFNGKVMQSHASASSLGSLILRRFSQLLFLSAGIHTLTRNDALGATVKGDRLEVIG